MFLWAAEDSNISVAAAWAAGKLAGNREQRDKGARSAYLERASRTWKISVN